MLRATMSLPARLFLVIATPWFTALIRHLFSIKDNTATSSLRRSFSEIRTSDFTFLDSLQFRRWHPARGCLPTRGHSIRKAPPPEVHMGGYHSCSKKTYGRLSPTYAPDTCARQSLPSQSLLQSACACAAISQARATGYRIRRRRPSPRGVLCHVRVTFIYSQASISWRSTIVENCPS